MDEHSLENLSYMEIKDMIDEINNQIFHLEKSQQEIFKILEIESDHDLFLAYGENKDCIRIKNQRIEFLKEYLLKRDPGFALEHYNNFSPPIPFSSSTAGPQMLDDDMHEDNEALLSNNIPDSTIIEQNESTSNHEGGIFL